MTLTITLEAAHPVTLRAAWRLREAWRTIGGRASRLATHARVGGPRVRLGLGSLVRPSAVVRFDVPFDSDQAGAAERLALSIAAWDSLDGRESWRALSAPLPRGPRYGVPDLDRPWALTLDPSRRAPDAQLHVIGGVPAGDVWWPAWPSAVAAVLGRADYVLGDADPLVYDAIRAGVIVRRVREPIAPVGSVPSGASRPSPPPPPPASGRGERAQSASASTTPRDAAASVGSSIGNGTADGADTSRDIRAPGFAPELAGLIPPSLAGDDALWRHVAQAARDVHASGRAPAPLMTPEWIARGRERVRAHLAAPPSPWQRARRRHDKLRRDPARFFADSKHPALRRLGQIIIDRQ